MKIQGSNSIEYINRAYKRNREPLNIQEKKSDFRPQQDRIEISEASKALKSRIENLDSKDEEIDWKKVETIRQAIAKGTYKVSPEGLSDKLLDELSTQSRPEEE